MAQEISTNPSFFGQLGKGLGRGLADVIPREVERQRLSSGLSQFAKESVDRSPLENLAALASIPGALDRPQLIQSFSDLAKIQNHRNAYRNLGGNASNAQRSSPDLREFQESNLLDQATNQPLPQREGFDVSKRGGKQIDRSQPPFVNQERLTGQNPAPYGQSQLAGYNPADQRALTRLPWTPQQRDSRVNQYLNQGFMVDQAERKAADDESRYLEEATARQKQQQELDTRQKKAEDKLTKYLETRLEKTGEGVYKDISGDMLADLERKMSRELVEHPDKSADDVADDFSKRALNLAKTKKEVKGLGEKTGFESLFTGDKVLNKLKAFQKPFAEAGNQEEYYNILRDKFGLSPQGAASVAYPLSNEVKQYISSYKPKNPGLNQYKIPYNPEKIDANSRKAALDISQKIGEDDSLLSIARTLSEQDPYFDQRAFFDEISSNPDIRLNKRQQRESGVGEKDFLPTWGDVKVLPALRRPIK